MCIIWATALIVSSILQMYYLTVKMVGFFANEVIFYIQIYTHYLVSFRYFLNEYYMCAILHYMSYDSVKCDPHKTMLQWLQYHRYRDIWMTVYQFGAGILLISLGLINIIIVIVLDVESDDGKDDKDTEGELYYVYGDKVVYLILESACLGLRALIAAVFITAMIRLNLAKSKAKRKGYKHIVSLPSCWSMSQLPNLIAICGSLIILIALVSYSIAQDEIMTEGSAATMNLWI